MKRVREVIQFCLEDSHAVLGVDRVGIRELIRLIVSSEAEANALCRD
jgi:hypothetical protein